MTSAPNERRVEKRELALSCLKGEIRYVKFSWLRERRFWFACPSGLVPMTPKATEPMGKKKWESMLYQFKREVDTWSAFVDKVYAPMGVYQSREIPK